MYFLSTAHIYCCDSNHHSYYTIAKKKLMIITSVIMDSVFIYQLALLFVSSNNMSMKIWNKNILNYFFKFGIIR